MIKPTAEQARRWSDDLLNDHLKNCSPATGYVCPGCTNLNRAAFEAEVIEDGIVAPTLVEGWL